MEWKFNIPPFAHASGHMKPSDLSMTETVAIHRVHVERAIARVKKNENFRLKSRS